MLHENGPDLGVGVYQNILQIGQQMGGEVANNFNGAEDGAAGSGVLGVDGAIPRTSHFALGAFSFPPSDTARRGRGRVHEVKAACTADASKAFKTASGVAARPKLGRLNLR